jgi:hypothetical protein
MPLLNDISLNAVKFDFVNLPNLKKINCWFIGECVFYIDEIEGMYLKKFYDERTIILAQ